MMSKSSAKMLGQFFTPQEVAATLVRWLAPGKDEKLLDPSCGDGRFIREHRKSVGIDLSNIFCLEARNVAPWAEVHEADFFTWASRTQERFHCVAGNPPFIRYQIFSGEVRKRALEMCAREGANFSALTSSWAPFVVIASSLLRLGGRIAFVVPAEIGHSTYAVTLLQYLAGHFDRVVVVAVKEKIFPRLSEGAWLLYTEGYGGKSRHIELAAWSKFQATERPPTQTKKITLETLHRHGNRLRKFLLPDHILEYYFQCATAPGFINFGSIARISVGYVTGANDFFHLRPSDAERLHIPQSLLKVAIRKGEQLPQRYVGEGTVKDWISADEQVLLLDLSGVDSIPRSVKAYLDSEAAMEARQSYKCRNRNPWFAVPDVSPPDAFLSYMSGRQPSLVINAARCVCTNSVHAVRLRKPIAVAPLLKSWTHPMTNLSQELEGHPLGGGLLKIEPGEAGRIVLPLNLNGRDKLDGELLEQGLNIARSWRLCE
jgi:adenine-specific DNA-methyltransferase